MARPNVILICTDQQRSDSLGCAGNPYARTPNLDQLAASGARFTRHSTPMQICSPSRATMFTGLYPRHHQLITNGRALDPAVPTLTSILAGNGYRTHSVGKQHLQPLLAPVDKGMPDSRAFWKTPESENWTGPYYGFSTIDLLLGESDTATLAGHYARWLKENYPGADLLLSVPGGAEAPPTDLDEIWRSRIPSELHYNSWITDCAIDFLDASSGDPFFLYVSYPDPHHPFAPPASYADRYDPATMPLPDVRDGELNDMPAYYEDLYPVGEGFRELYWAARDDLEAGSMITTAGVSHESMRRATAYTYAMIEMIDDGIGRLLERADARGLIENTIVMFTSDHGELLGTHGLLHKGPPPYRQLTEVSMLMRGPGIAAGQTIDALTNHIDIAPTLLALTGVEDNGVTFDGRSMVPLSNGDEDHVREFDFGEYHPTVRAELYNQTVRTDGWRLTIYPKMTEWGELFDLIADPGEHRNLFNEASASDVRKELEGLLASQFIPQDTVENECLCKW